MPDFRAVGEAMTSLISNTRRHLVHVPVYIDSKGHIQNAGVVFHPVPALHKAPMAGPHGVVLHRPVTRSARGTLASFARGIGTHFVVDLDGTIIQAASLNSHTAHVGPIRSRCLNEQSCPSEVARMIADMSPMEGHRHEKKKPYPQRYPTNQDSIGIEVVGTYDDDTKRWDAATPAQKKSVALLIGILKKEYRLTDADIYEHDRISRKTAGEGAGIYDGGSSVPVDLPPRFF